MKSPATPHPSSMPTPERLSPTSNASGTGTAASAPRDREAIVALLALMLRGLLSGVPGAGANA